MSSESSGAGADDQLDSCFPWPNDVVKRLADNWHKRATVKKVESDLDALFETDRQDYPVALTPWAGRGYDGLADAETLGRVLFLAALAFHRHTMVVEREIVAPTFAMSFTTAFTGDLAPSFEKAIVQASVDEQYHTLMHLNAAECLRRNRPWSDLPSSPPDPWFVRAFQDRCAEQPTAWQRDLVRLAFTTITEISIDAYLYLVAKDQEVQRVNSVVAALHWRDEKCHALIAEELAAEIFKSLNDVRQDFFMRQMVDAVEIFSRQDITLWHHIFQTARVPDGYRILKECARSQTASFLIKDNSGVYRLWGNLIDSVHSSRFDWILERHEITARPREGLA